MQGFTESMTRLSEAFGRMPGIGRKTAERLIVELRDRLDAPPAGARDAGLLPRAERFEDAVAALTRLGYTAAQAQEAVRRVAGAAENLSLEDLVRRALALVGKKVAGQALERADRAR